MCNPSAPPPRRPFGTDLVDAGACPIGERDSMACYRCKFGHLSECHHPQTCVEAYCSFVAAGLVGEPAAFDVLDIHPAELAKGAGE